MRYEELPRTTDDVRHIREILAPLLATYAIKETRVNKEDRREDSEFRVRTDQVPATVTS